MKTLLPFLLLLTGCFGFSVKMEHEKEAVSICEDVRQVMHRYFNAFNNDDVETIAQCWHAPGSIEMGAKVTLSTPADISDFYREKLKSLHSEGFDHSKLIREEFEWFGGDTATTRIVFRRIGKDGQVIPTDERRASYRLIRVDGKWGIQSLLLPNPGESNK